MSADGCFNGTPGSGNGGSVSTATQLKLGSEGLESFFAQQYEVLRDEVLAEFEDLAVSSDVAKELRSYYRRCLDHVLSGGKMTRGLTVVKALEASLGNEYGGEKTETHNDSTRKKHYVVKDLEELDEETIYRQAAILGWCVEWLQAFFLTVDDVMDHSLTRRGLPCWYRVEGVTASNAINDSLYLNCCIYKVLRRHLGKRSDYLQLIELLQEMSFNTVIGQHLDTNAQPIDSSAVDLQRITSERYQAIVRYKTAHYSFYLPCALGMALGGIRNPELCFKAKNICLALGEYFQVQDDVLDCYASPEVLGKTGTDIEEKKCSWLLVQVVSLASPEELEGLKKSYGNKDSENVKWVKDLYRKYDLYAKYQAYEETTVARIREMIKELNHTGLQSLFTFLLGKVYKRQK